MLERRDLSLRGCSSTLLSQEEVAEREKVQCVVLEYLRDVRDLPTDKCRLLIDTITTPRLARPQFGELKGHHYTRRELSDTASLAQYLTPIHMSYLPARS